MNNSPMNILLIDDDDVAAESVVRSLRKHGLQHAVTIAKDGMEALEILRGQHPYLTINKPFLILLDLNMPRMNGFEFLHEVRADKNLSKNVVFILTTSSADSDRSKAYEENIAGYMTKSAVGPQFSKLANLLESYHSAVNLPG